MSALLAYHVEVGRGVPMQAAFTAKELREITKLPGVQVHVPQEAMQLTEADRAEMKASRIKKRVYDILKAASEAHCIRGEPSLPLTLPAAHQAAIPTCAIEIVPSATWG